MSNDKNAHGSDEKAKELATEYAQEVGKEFLEAQLEQSIHAATLQQPTATTESILKDLQQPTPSTGDAVARNLEDAGLKAIASPSVAFAAKNLYETASKEASDAFEKGDYETGGIETAKAAFGSGVLGAGVIISAGTGTIMGTVGTVVLAASGVGFFAGVAIFGGAVVWKQFRKNKD
jgi:hypothetical protein